MPEQETCAKAGVDIDAGGKAKELIKKHARSTLRPEVLSGVGSSNSQIYLRL